MGVCGTVFGDIIDDKLHLVWRWAGNSGRGLAHQEGAQLIAISGFGESQDNGGKLVFYQRAEP